jgi:serine protease AprX
MNSVIHFSLKIMKTSRYWVMKARSITTTTLVALLLFFSIAGSPFSQRAGAKVQSHSVQSESVAALAPASKLSPDLQEIIDTPAKASRYGLTRFSASDSILVIIQASTKSSKKLLRALNESGGILLDHFDNLNSFSARLTAEAVAQLAAREEVSGIALDRPVQATGHLENTTGANLVRNYGTAATGRIDGAGIGIAILDSGIRTNHQALNGRVVYSVDFTGEGRTDDPYGHGTHVAGIAAGSSTIANGAYLGVAPAANLINVRVLNSQGQGSSSTAIAGINWCISNKTTYNIRVINLSLGTTAVSSYTSDPLCQAVKRATDAGIVVCVAAGNRGKDAQGDKVYGAISSPGIEPSAITVGAANTYGTDQRSDDGVTSYSSRGPTRGYWKDAGGVKHYDNLIKPDIVAPGNKIISAEMNNSYLARTYNLDARVSAKGDRKMMFMNGTSVASPAVAGAAALIIERNPSLTPNMVKAALEYTAQPLSQYNNYEQGAGLLNVEGAVRLAGMIRTDLATLALGAPLLTGATPSETTTIAGQSLHWGEGVIQKWNFLHGQSLIQKYQKIYGTSTLLSNGVLLAGGTLLADSTLLAGGTLLSDGVLLADGTLLSNGTLLTNGTLLAGGTLLSDATLLADGIVISDSALPVTVGQSVVGYGDATAYMAVIGD